MASITVNLKIPNAAAADLAVSGERRKCVTNLINILKAFASGAKLINMDVTVSSSNPVAASGSIVLSYSDIDADDTVTIGGVTLTAKASGANGTTQFNKQTSATVTAENLATCINANTTLNKHVVASAATGTVTVTAKMKGSIGNLIVMSTSDATAFALTQMASGTGGPEGTAVTFAKG